MGLIRLYSKEFLPNTFLVFSKIQLFRGYLDLLGLLGLHGLLRLLGLLGLLGLLEFTPKTISKGFAKQPEFAGLMGF